jgi:hypothetical protein
MNCSHLVFCVQLRSLLKTQEEKIPAADGKVSFLFKNFLVGLRFEIIASHLQSRCESHLQSIFALVIWHMGSHELFAPADLKLQSSQAQPPK